MSSPALFSPGCLEYLSSCSSPGIRHFRPFLGLALALAFDEIMAFFPGNWVAGGGRIPREELFLGVNLTGLWPEPDRRPHVASHAPPEGHATTDMQKQAAFCASVLLSLHLFGFLENKSVKNDETCGVVRGDGGGCGPSAVGRGAWGLCLCISSPQTRHC